ncbi:putative calcium-binding protein CML44 isoform X1 [Capsicum galapagoense]
MIVVFLSLFQPGSFILNFQAKEIMSKLNESHIHRIFDKLDEDGDGLVSLDELNGLLDKIGACTGLDELQSLVGKTSLNFIDFLFFYEAMLKKNNGEEIKEDNDVDNKLEDDLVEAFKVFDLNGDGFISCEELQKLLSRLGLWDEKEGSDCRNMIHMYDTNLDGVLDFEEFKNMMLLSNSEGIPNL